MTFTRLSPLPDEKSVLTSFPLTEEIKGNITAHKAEIQAILTGADPRLLLIIGPCSAWPNTAVLEYAKRLHAATKPLLKHIKPILRVYTQKPRTTFGWKGSLLHPNPTGKPDVLQGISYCREMMLEVAKIGLPIADEILYPDLCLPYLSDLYSYGCIGARSSEHQRKRMVASGVPFPMGIKNPTSGDLTKAVQSVQVAQAPQDPFPHIGHIVTTSGNPHAHMVLRGGGRRPNYYDHVLDLAEQMMQDANVENPAIVVDASHENSMRPDGNKDHTQQISVLESVLAYRKKHTKTAVKGIMIESFLEDGRQKTPTVHGLSLTDPCLGWEQTNALLTSLTSHLS